MKIIEDFTDAKQTILAGRISTIRLHSQDKANNGNTENIRRVTDLHTNQPKNKY